MTRAADPTSKKTTSSTAAMAAWVIAQIVVLLVSASEVSLYARPTEPTSNLALQIVLTAQLIFASLLAPILFTSWRTSAGVIAAALPFACLGGLLSASSAAQVLRGESFAITWMLAVASWSMCVNSAAARAIVASAATVLTLGLAALAYVASEFRGSILLDVEWGSRACTGAAIALAASLVCHVARQARRARERVSLSTATSNNCG